MEMMMVVLMSYTLVFSLIYLFVKLYDTSLRQMKETINLYNKKFKELSELIDDIKLMDGLYENPRDLENVEVHEGLNLSKEEDVKE